jgi:hypothetical protein
MAAVEQQHSEIHALVMAALQASRESPDAALHVDDALTSNLDDPLSDDFIGTPGDQRARAS